MQHRDSVLEAAFAVALATASEAEAEVVLRLVAVLASLGSVSIATRHKLGTGKDPCALPSLLLAGAAIGSWLIASVCAPLISRRLTIKQSRHTAAFDANDPNCVGGW